jgi:hypothetical protein
VESVFAQGRLHDHLRKSVFFQEAIRRPSSHTEVRGDLGHWTPLVKHRQCLMTLLCIHGWLSAHMLAFFSRRSHASTGSLADQIALEFGQGSHHVKDQSST